MLNEKKIQGCPRTKIPCECLRASSVVRIHISLRRACTRGAWLRDSALSACLCVRAREWWHVCVCVRAYTFWLYEFLSQCVYGYVQVSMYVWVCMHASRARACAYVPARALFSLTHRRRLAILLMFMFSYPDMNAVANGGWAWSAFFSMVLCVESQSTPPSPLGECARVRDVQRKHWKSTP